jgi:hypothetical protein
MEFLRWFDWTLDQHAKEIKPFPAHYPHIEPMVRLWQDNPRLSIRKSRQMEQTWLFCSLALWDAMFHPGTFIFLQSAREDDAIGNEFAGTGLLGRCKFVLSHIPAREILVPRIEARANTLAFPGHNSLLWAIPQGGDIVRSHTISGLLSDEAAFQPEFADAYTAALPCLGKDGWFVILSTPNPGFAQMVHEDRVGEAM